MNIQNNIQDSFHNIKDNSFNNEKSKFIFCIKKSNYISDNKKFLNKSVFNIINEN